jgi:ABC-type transport system involved in multi-copper enzyme maturation permease subunit
MSLVSDVALPTAGVPVRGGLLSPRARRFVSLIWVIVGREWRLTRLLFANELRELLVSRALWAMVLISAPLVGFSLIQAVRRYSEVSSNALRLPQLAANLNPLDGIEVPTLGAVYLMNTFLLPFVAIRLIGNGKQTGALKLMLQLPVGQNRLVAIKLAALGVGWCIALVPTLSALGIWAFVLGGHLYLPELMTALLGHLLYALVIAGFAFLAAALTESSATAAILALSFTLGSWILEFAASTTTGLVRAVAAFSLTPALRGLERGLLGSPTALTLLVLGFAFLALTVVWMPPGTSRRQKLLQSGAVVGVAAQMLLLVIQLPLYVDVTEDRRNSFNPADERALHQMSKELKVSVNLASNDSRLADLDRNVLSKLPRVMPQVTITYPETSSTGLFGGTTGANYGLVTYTYGGKQGTSRATTAREVLPLIEALGGRTVTPDKVPAYPGYPLVTSAEGSSALFYVLLPGLAIAGWWFNQRAPRGIAGVRGGQPLPARWPRLERDAARAGRVALIGVAGLLVLQLVPYGHNHVNLTIGAPTAAAAATCQTVFPPGDESTMRLSDFKARVAGQVANLNRVLSGLAANSPSAVRAEYAQFANGYRGIYKELAELYPGRCPRLNDAAAGADRTIIASPTIDTVAASQWIYALDVGLFNLSQDLDTRIRQAGPDQVVGLENPETDRPSITGMPAWNNGRTQALVSRACGACHSNQPNMPWYTNVAPLSWAIQHQVDAGRAVLNVSEWDRPQGLAAAQAASAVQRGAMPPGWAAAIDPRLQLSNAERDELVRGLQATFRTSGTAAASK